jgi:hypothetical protein
MRQRRDGGFTFQTPPEIAKPSIEQKVKSLKDRYALSPIRPPALAAGGEINRPINQAAKLKIVS